MALSRNHLGDNVATATSTAALITPTPSALLLASLIVRRNGALPNVLTCTDNGGNTWTQIANGSLFLANGIRLAMFSCRVSATPGSFTVTAASTAATSIGLLVEEFTGAESDLGNVSPVATDSIGDPTAILPQAPNINSIVLGCYCCLGSNPLTEPPGFTEIVPLLSPAGMRGQNSYAQITSTSATWSSVNPESAAAMVEVKRAASTLTPSFKSVSVQAATSSNTTVNVIYPAGISTGDVALLWTHADNNSAQTISAGWTGIGTQVAVGTGLGARLWWRRPVPADSGTQVTCTRSTAGSNGVFQATIAIFKDCTPTGTPFEGYGTPSSGTGTLVPSVAVTTTGFDRLVVQFYAVGNDIIPDATPTGWTQNWLYSHTIGNDGIQWSDSRQVSVPTAVAAINRTISLSEPFIVAGLALLPNDSISGSSAGQLGDLAGSSSGVHGVAGSGAASFGKVAGTVLAFYSSTPISWTADSTSVRADSGNYTADGASTPAAGASGNASGSLGKITGDAGGGHSIAGWKADITSIRADSVNVTADGGQPSGINGFADATFGKLVGASPGGIHSIAGSGVGFFLGLLGTASGVHGTVAAAAGSLGKIIGVAIGTQAALGAGAGSLGNIAGIAAGQQGSGATAAALLGQLQGAAVGAQVHVGTAAGALGSITAAAAGTQIHIGVAAGALGSITGSAGGIHRISGVGLGNLQPLTAAASGVQGVMGSASASLGDMTGGADGTVSSPPIVGWTADSTIVRADSPTYTADGGQSVNIGNAILGKLAGHADGNYLAPAQGNAAAMLGSLLVAASGLHSASAAASAFLGDLTGLSSGVHGFGGTSTATLGKLLGLADAVHAHAGIGVGLLGGVQGAAAGAQGYVGVFDAGLRPLAGLGQGTHAAAGSGAGTLQSMQGSAVGSLVYLGPASADLGNINGLGAANHGARGQAADTLGKLAGVAAAEHLAPVIATAAVSLGSLTGLAAGSQIVLVQGAVTMRSLEGVATGLLVPRGSGSALLANLSGFAFVDPPSTFSATVQAQLPALLGAGDGAHGVTGPAEEDLGNLTGAAAGVQITTGSAAAAVGKLLGVASGVQGIPGTAAATLGNLAGTVVGKIGLDIEGAGIGSLHALQASASGLAAHAGPAVGTLTPLLGLAIAGAGASGAADALCSGMFAVVQAQHGASGAGDSLLPGLQGDADGLVAASGLAAGTIGPLDAAANGLLVPQGTGAATLKPLQGHATATAGHVWQPFKPVLVGSTGKKKGLLIGSAGGQRRLTGS